MKNTSAKVAKIARMVGLTPKQTAVLRREIAQLELEIAEETRNKILNIMKAKYE